MKKWRTEAKKTKCKENYGVRSQASDDPCKGGAGEQEGALGGRGTLFLDAGAGYTAIVTL